MGNDDAHYLMKRLETEAIARVTEMYLKASLMRKETRGGHYREDYPERNDAEWLGWIKIARDGGDMALTLDKVPVERYKHPIERYYQDNFAFPENA